MQTRLILNRNYNFQFWTAGSPDNWTVVPTGTAVIQLDRHFPRDHPQSRVFPNKLKAHDLVKDGDFAFRSTDTSGGGGDVTLATAAVAVAPGQMISTSLVYRISAAQSTMDVLIEFYDDLAKTTTLASVLQPVVPAGSNLTRQTQGMPGTYSLVAASEILLEDEGGPVLFWARYGVVTEVPAGAGAMGATVNFASDSADASIDVDDFRFEAVDNRVHAGG